MLPSKPEIEIEVSAIASALVGLPIGQIMAYADINRVAGRDVTKENRYILLRAVKKAEQDSGARFATVHATGVKRLSAEDLPGIGNAVRTRVKNAAKRGYARLTDLKYNDITPESRRLIDAERSLLGAISAIASDTSAKKVQAGTTTGPLPVAHVMDALR